MPFVSLTFAFCCPHLKGKIIEYPDSVISTALVSGFTGCALGMVLAGGIEQKT